MDRTLALGAESRVPSQFTLSWLIWKTLHTTVSLAFFPLSKNWLSFFLFYLLALGLMLLLKGVMPLRVHQCWRNGQRQAKTKCWFDYR